MRADVSHPKAFLVQSEGIVDPTRTPNMADAESFWMNLLKHLN